MTISLKQRLSEERILLAPGVYDALSGLIAEQAGAEAVYLSGASIIPASQSGRAGWTPQAASTAAGNFAGCAVESTMTGVSPPAFSRAT